MWERNYITFVPTEKEETSLLFIKDSTCIRNTGSALRRSDELLCCIVFIVLFGVGGETEALFGQSVA